jgi:hypothetical protein
LGGGGGDGGGGGGGGEGPGGAGGLCVVAQKMVTGFCEDATSVTTSDAALVDAVKAR